MRILPARVRLLRFHQQLTRHRRKSRTREKGDGSHRAGESENGRRAAQRGLRPARPRGGAGTAFQHRANFQGHPGKLHHGHLRRDLRILPRQLRAGGGQGRRHFLYARHGRPLHGRGTGSPARRQEVPRPRLRLGRHVRAGGALYAPTR